MERGAIGRLASISRSMAPFSDAAGELDPLLARVGVAPPFGVNGTEPAACPGRCPGALMDS
jgi:hypothetical protein